ncbi:MAG: M1 family peptidase, partial [Flavobacteriaceae bacterium]|nr:M1 family peptidase [Flavobacteriaceae bacterium]
MKFFRTIFLIFLVCSCSNKDNGKWQQHVSYKMVIDVDAENRSYSGTQELVYTNNSSDTISRVFYHLYFNAFQPNSQMDVRSRNIQDPDRRVRDRISKLKPEEIGFIK